jgi:voltage-gated potassium channel
LVWRIRGSQRILAHEIYHKLRNLVFMVVLLFLVGTAGYSVSKGVSLEQGLGLTLETLAAGHEREVPTGPRVVQVLLQLFGVLVFWFAVWTFGDLVLEGKVSGWIREVRIIMGEQSLRDHYVICGAGRVGIHVAELLEKKGEPFVILEKSGDLTAKLKKRKWLVIHGDVLDEELLKEAGILRAKGVVGAIPETEKNVMLTLLAKQLNPKVEVYARAEKEEFIKQLRLAGAKAVVMPEVVGAEEIVAAMGRG